LRVESFSEKRAGQPLHSLYLLYHELRPLRSEYSYVCETAQFERHIDYFVHVQKEESRGLWPEVTFDDGHISNFEYALPILQSWGLVARFFITVGWTGRKPGYMGWRELRSLHQSGQLIGAHGWSHALLTNCAQEDLDRELSGARLMLEDKLGTSITTMSLPGGRYNQRVLAACRRAGYTQIFTSVPRAEQMPPGLLVGRLNVRGDMTLDRLRKVLQPGNHILARLERQYRIKAAAKTLMGDWLYEKVWAILNRKEPDSGDGGDYAE
jgi:peptidoglycan/xylan/chitin deacetylase (PgdA/CDA1 family)